MKMMRREVIKRDRTTFFFYDYNYRIDLDRDINQKTGKVSYQYEIEFLNEGMMDLQKMEQVEAVEDAIYFMNPGEPVKQKPIPIKRGYIPFLKNYVILPKKDGETVYLFINSHGINIYNKYKNHIVF